MVRAGRVRSWSRVADATVNGPGWAAPGARKTEKPVVRPRASRCVHAVVGDAGKPAYERTLGGVEDRWAGPKAHGAVTR
jgi:hypothetical protein